MRAESANRAGWDASERTTRGAGRVDGAACGADEVNGATRDVGRVDWAMRGTSGVDMGAGGRGGGVRMGPNSLRVLRLVDEDDPASGKASSSKTTCQEMMRWVRRSR